MKITDAEIEKKLSLLVVNERKHAAEILELIVEAEKRSIHLLRAYPTVFEWLVGAYRYSQPAAYRRILAARIFGAVPEVKDKIESGLLSLSVLSRMQTAIQSTERRTREKVPLAVKKDLLKKLEGKTYEEAEKEILGVFPAGFSDASTLRVVSKEQSRLSVVLDEDAVAALRRVKELIAHSCDTWAEVIGWLALDYVKRKDPLR